MEAEQDEAPLSRLGEAALAWAEMGWPVFPVIPNDKRPLTEHGFKDATTDVKAIRAWWTATPNANIGTPTDGLLVLDIDGQGNAWLAGDPDLTLQLAIGAMQRTPRGGVHYIYKKPAGKTWRNTAGKIAHMVDTRSDGGYIVLATSEINGKRYTLVPGHEPEERDDLDPPPEWLCRVLDEIESGGPSKRSDSGVIGNVIPPGTRNDTLARLAGNMRRSGMGFEEVAAALTATNRTRCLPPLPDKEVSAIAASICRYEPDQVTVAMVEDWARQDSAAADGMFSSTKELVVKNPQLRKPVLNGLLREGEIMNIIAPPKMGKSWMVTDLALAIVTGRPWLGTFAVEKGDALIMDNELHPETSANRIPRVAEARGLVPSDYEDHLFVANLRGQLKDLRAMRPFFDRIQPGQFKVIILDAFYRFLPAKTDENDNGSITMLYNELDYHARRIGCAIILIHHASKGEQGNKAVTDVGAGAGAQARATDTHLILRKHREADTVVMESAIRSWPHQDPMALRFDFPVFQVVSGVDTSALEGKPEPKEEAPELSPEEFVGKYLLLDSPRQEATVQHLAEQDGVRASHSKRLLAAAVDLGLAHRWDLGDRRVGYAREPAPVVQDDAEEAAKALPEADKAKLILELHRQDPTLPRAEIARRVGVAKSYVTKVLGPTDE